MSKRCSIALLFVFCANWLQAADNAPATPDTLQGILARVHQHADSNSWRERGWKDQPIETWLEEVTGKIAKAADFPGIKLPVRFADVTPSQEEKPQSLKNALLVGKHFDWPTTSLSRCIVLADGNITAKRLENCVVVARGVVSAVNSHSSVLVAGAYVRILADGESRKIENGSLLVTPGWVHLDEIYGTVIAAGEGVTTGSRLEGGIFVNAAIVLNEMSALMTGRRPRSVKVRGLSVGELVNHSLHEQLELAGVIYAEAINSSDRLLPAVLINAALRNQNQARPQPTGVVLRIAGRRYVANLGQPVVSQSQQPVEALAGWRLSYVNDKIAVFSNDEADAIIRLEEF